MIAGTLEYGGSKHVATAVLEMNRKFPGIRSALNLKYEQKLIQRSKEKKFHVLSYNRAKEPMRIKKKENSSIAWGVKNSIKNATALPDMVYHKGDFGKEPMILVFGRDPNDVVKKVSRFL